MKALFRTLAMLLALTPARAADKSNFYLHAGDRVVFYGDSITDQRLYTTYTESYVVTRFPDMPVTFVHSGWGGDKVSGGGGGNIDRRLTRDVFAYKPTVLTIMLGMNDGLYRAFDEKVFNTYAKGYEHIIESVKSNLPGIRITVIDPSPYDDFTREPNWGTGYNAVLVRYGEFVKELAGREHLDFADLNTGVADALRKAKGFDEAEAKKLVPDRVHPGPAGHILMAGELLKAWHAPALVSRVEIDAEKKKVAASENAEVSGLKAEGDISWTCQERALPMPIDASDPLTSLALKSSDFADSLDQEVLKISGLRPGKYLLSIDGEELRRLTAAQWAEGVNLALLHTPMLKQANEVHRMTLQHNDIHFARWRQVQLRATDDIPAFKDAIASLDSLEEAIVKKQRQTAQPHQHKFMLKAVAE